MSADDTKTAPSVADYAAAFYGLETSISQILRHVRVADFLASYLTDRLDKENHSERDLADLVYGQVADLRQEIDALDTAFLDKFNELVGRENASKGFPS